MRTTIVIVLLAVALGAGLASCGKPTPKRPEGPLRVAVTIPPLAGLVEPMLPADAELATLVPAGVSVHTYQLSPEDVSLIAQADLIVGVGFGLEGGLDRALRRLDAERVLRMSDLPGLPQYEGDTAAQHDHDHDHDHGHDHHHGGVDPHLWLDPAAAAVLVRAVAERLGPDADERAQALLAEIDAIDAAYRERLRPHAGRAIVTHHASFGRVARRYGLRVAEVLRAGDAAEPTPGQVARVVAVMQTEDVGALFVEPQFSDRLARRVAEQAGARVLVLDPLGSGDWTGLMRANLEVLVEGLAERAGVGP